MRLPSESNDRTISVINKIKVKIHIGVIGYLLAYTNKKRDLHVPSRFTVKGL